uniref:F-box domain-containing protein n=1 Tax=Rhabditophanes sp. KR3021 TaxID=114890 RepID=A0AC35TLR9_9BILA
MDEVQHECRIIALKQPHIFAACVNNLSLMTKMAETSILNYNRVSSLKSTTLDGTIPYQAKTLFIMQSNYHRREILGRSFEHKEEAIKIINETSEESRDHVNTLWLSLSFEDINLVEYVQEIGKHFLQKFINVNHIEIILSNYTDQNMIKFVLNFDRLMDVLVTKRIKKVSIIIDSEMETQLLLNNFEEWEIFFLGSKPHVKEVNINIKILYDNFDSQKKMVKLFYRIQSKIFKLTKISFYANIFCFDLNEIYPLFEFMRKPSNPNVQVRLSVDFESEMLSPLKMYKLEEITKYNYVKTDYEIDYRDFLKNFEKKSIYSCFANLNVLAIRNVEDVTDIDNWQLENILFSLRYLKSLKTLICESEMDSEITNDPESLTMKILCALPKTVNSLIFTSLSIDLSTFGNSLALAFPNLVHLRLKLKKNDQSFESYDENYFLPFSKLQILQLSCRYKTNFKYPDSLRILEINCCARKYGINPGEIGILENDNNSIKLKELKLLRHFSDTECKCGLIQNPFKHLKIKEKFPKRFKFIYLASVMDWEVYKKLYILDDYQWGIPY